MAKKYIKCPRCELNYILEGEEYCDVCKAELKIGPQLMFSASEELEGQYLCPVCKSKYVDKDEEMCESCRENSFKRRELEDDIDFEKDGEYIITLEDNTDEKDDDDDDESPDSEEAPSADSGFAMPEVVCCSAIEVTGGILGSVPVDSRETTITPAQRIRLKYSLIILRQTRPLSILRSCWIHS